MHKHTPPHTHIYFPSPLNNRGLVNFIIAFYKRLNKFKQSMFTAIIFLWSFVVGSRYCPLNSLRVLCSYSLSNNGLSYSNRIHFLTPTVPTEFSVSDNANQKHFVENMYLKKSKNKRCEGNVVTRSSPTRQLYIHSVSAQDPGSQDINTKNVHYWVVIYWIHREGNGHPLQYSCLENPMDREVWWATAHGFAKSQTQLIHLLHPTSLKFSKSYSFFSIHLLSSLSFII